ncbi:hypothetical protein GH714_014632 [Hevea brasiliensis]|uniref:non-specific serine/threonine protein kinase n=1 Tax=Hevea brasiliensis TaxID=3981 RepID=A0A6A6LXI2_HEVBR|nr:hypothetical protein GH714_014632 [Hevea brasiliensis]
MYRPLSKKLQGISGHGIAFVIAPTKGLRGSLPSQYLGLFNKTNNGNDTNHVFAVELDTIYSSEFDDINDNHVGIDINGLTSEESAPAGYHTNSSGRLANLTLASSQPMQIWVEYDGTQKQLNITLAAINMGKPSIPLLSVALDLSPYLLDTMKRKFAEVLEDWERDYGPHRFKYKDLYIATKGFRDKELLGSGGFGRVYRGVLPSSKIEIAVKKVSHETRQGMKVFVAEIVSIGRLRHRNLVTLLGYCRRKGELLLVYDCMPNGSLDKYLYDQPRVTLNWSQRFRVIKGVASGLFYLHEEWEQVVIHRDVKASNVLLDGELNGRLGDFGLARLYDHGTDPQTTHVVGTLGYLAPEHTRTGKATTKTDVMPLVPFYLRLLVRSKFGPRLYTRRSGIGVKLGLLCSHSVPEVRPSMRQVLQFLDRDIPLPELSSLGLSASGLTFAHPEGFSDYAMSYPSSMNMAFSHSSSVAESLLSGGR